METNGTFSLPKGWEQIPQQDVRKVRAEILAALGIRIRATWRGRSEPRYSEHTAIETIFRSHGITKIWREQNSSPGKNKVPDAGEAN